MENLKLTHVSSVFKFTGSDNKTYLVQWTPKKYDDPKFNAQVEVWQDNQLIATYRTSTFGNKSNAKMYVETALNSYGE